MPRLALRRSDLLTIYQCPGLPMLTDRAGVLSAASGGDNELCWALTVLGKILIYDDRLKLRHFIPQERLQISYLRKQAGIVSHGTTPFVDLRPDSASLKIAAVRSNSAYHTHTALMLSPTP